MFTRGLPGGNEECARSRKAFPKTSNADAAAAKLYHVNGYYVPVNAKVVSQQKCTMFRTDPFSAERTDPFSAELLFPPVSSPEERKEK